MPRHNMYKLSLTLCLLAVICSNVHAMCDSYCKNPCSQFAQPEDTVDECSDCTDDGTVKCFPGAPGYNSGREEVEEQPSTSNARRSDYEGIQVLPFEQLKADKRMKMVVFHWDGEKGGDKLIRIMQTLRADSEFAQYLWFHVDVSVDKGASDFKQENLPMTFSQTPEDGIGHFNGGDFNEDNFRKWHKFRTGEGWKDGHKVVRMEKDDLPHKIVELSKEQPIFLKMYEEWCHHCKSLKPHFMRSSNEAPGVTFVEVECAKSGGFCDHYFPGSGFPRVRLLNKGATKAHDYKGLTYMKMTEFANDPSKWKFDSDTGFGEEIKEEL